MQILRSLLRHALPDASKAFWRKADVLAAAPDDQDALADLNRLARRLHPDIAVTIERNHRGTPFLVFAGGETPSGIDMALTLKARPTRSWAFRTNHAHSPADWMRWSFRQSMSFYQQTTYSAPHWGPLVLYGTLCLSSLEHTVTCWLAGNDELATAWLGTSRTSLTDCWTHLQVDESLRASGYEWASLAVADRVIGALAPEDPCVLHDFPFHILREVVASDHPAVEIEMTALLWCLMAYYESKDVSSSVTTVLRWKRDAATRGERALCRALIANDPRLLELLVPILRRWLDPVRSTGTDADLYSRPVRHACALLWCRLKNTRFTRDDYVNVLAGNLERPSAPA